MKNKNMTAKERGLLKGAIRRVFSRSELRRRVIATIAIQHHDPSRPRVKKWSRCPECKQPTPSYLVQVDHVSPIIPLDTSLEEIVDRLGWDIVIDSTWCDENNLRPICIFCHKAKSKAETKARAANRKLKKNKKGTNK